MAHNSTVTYFFMVLPKNDLTYLAGGSYNLA